MSCEVYEDYKVNDKQCKYSIRHYLMYKGPLQEWSCGSANQFAVAVLLGRRKQ